jgi:hypothetical protein
MFLTAGEKKQTLHELRPQLCFKLQTSTDFKSHKGEKNWSSKAELGP